VTRATPFELGLSAELDIERQRFINSWICDWYKFNMDGKVTDVDDFRGGRINLGGGAMQFGSDQQAIYWQAIERYFKIKSHEVFGAWQSATASYPVELRYSSLERTQGILLSFIGSLVDKARDTDRRLRGRGFPDRVSKYNPTRELQIAGTEIARLVEAHKRLLPARASAETQSSAAYDVFVCHASEDKVTFVNAFVQALEAQGLKVWYDTSSIPWGGYPRQHIDRGLAASRFGVVVLSPHFFNKVWPQSELEALLQLQANGGTQVLPIWHEITREQVVAQSPLMGPIWARKTSEHAPATLAEELAAMCRAL